MAIKINYFHEPLSAKSFLLSGKTVLVESDEGQLLERELRRYCDSAVNGRSFLIAGHRGSGKTTLVANAFLKVWKESEESGMLLRPLLVKLHGPNLFPQRDSPPENAKPRPSASASPAPDAAPDAKSDAQIALEQITLGLHRAVAGEFTARFWRRLDTDPWPPNSAEFCAQFETEVHDIAPSGRLREFWQRTGSVVDGVLFRRAMPHAHVQGGRQKTEQGMRELVALGGVLEAYRRISGEYRRQQSSSNTLQEKLERSVQVSAGKQELAKPLAALATGGAVGVLSAVGAAAPPVTATLLGLLAAFGALGVFKFSATRVRERAYAAEDSFVYDLSVSTLDRVLPILIERLKSAGLAPIFVVDELDKVELLSERVLAMVHHLKKLVAEHAFFCFLTDRGYYEQIVMDGSERAYDVSHSYYSHRLLIAFSPERFDSYLLTRLTVDDAAPAVSSIGVAPANAQQLVGGQVVADAVADLLALRWILRHRSQLHQLDLDREIAAISDAEGKFVSIPPGDVRSIRHHQIHLTLQVAIERLIREPFLQYWISDRPVMRQLLYDALYYISRQWLAGEEMVDVSAAGKPAFARYLERRMNREKGDAAPGGETPVRGWRRKESSIREKDLSFLLEQIGELAWFLSDEQDPARPDRQFLLATFRKPNKEPEVDQVVQRVLLIEESESICIRVDAGVYAFRYDRRGALTAAGKRDEDARRERAAAAMPSGPQPVAEALSRTWSDHAAYIEAFAQMLTGLTPPSELALREPLSFTTLAEQFRIVDTTPAWSSVKAAIERLRSTPASALAPSAGTESDLPPAADAKQEEDARLVQSFRALLARSRHVIALGLLCGAIIGKPSGRSAADVRITLGLDALSRGFRFPLLPQKEVQDRLAQLLADLQASQFIDLSAFMDRISDADASPGDYATAVTEGLEAIHQRAVLNKPAAETIEKAWGHVELRVLAHLADKSAEVSVNTAELLTATSGLGPARYVALDLGTMTVTNWSTALIDAWDAIAKKRTDPPAWLAYAAFRALGVDLRELLNGSSLPKAQMERWQFVAGVRVGPGTRRLTIFYATATGSPAATWAPVSDGVLIAAPEDDLRRLFNAWSSLPQPVLTPGLTLPAIYAGEIEPGKGQAEDKMAPPAGAPKVIDRLFGDAPLSIRVYLHEPKEPRPPYIIAPRDAADVIAHTQRWVDMTGGGGTPE